MAPFGADAPDWAAPRTVAGQFQPVGSLDGGSLDGVLPEFNAEVLARVQELNGGRLPCNSEQIPTYPCRPNPTLVGPSFRSRPAYFVTRILPQRHSLRKLNVRIRPLARSTPRKA